MFNFVMLRAHVSIGRVSNCRDESGIYLNTLSAAIFHDISGSFY